MNKNSSEFDYGKNGSPKYVLKNSGPAGILVALCLAMAIVAIIALVLLRIFS